MFTAAPRWPRGGGMAHCAAFFLSDRPAAGAFKP